MIVKNGVVCYQELQSVYIIGIDTKSILPDFLSHIYMERTWFCQVGQQLTATGDPVGILYKSIAGRYRLASYPDGPITARYKFIKNASWGAAYIGVVLITHQTRELYEPSLSRTTPKTVDIVIVHLITNKIE